MFSSSWKKEGDRPNTHPATMKVAAPALAGPAKADRISPGTWNARTRAGVVIAVGRVSGIRNNAPASTAARTMSSTYGDVVGHGVASARSPLVRGPKVRPAAMATDA